jgi:hypothetical protein
MAKIARSGRAARTSRKPPKPNVDYWVGKAQLIGYPIAVVHNCADCAPRKKGSFTVNNEQELRDFLGCSLFNIKLEKSEAA